MIIFKGNMSHRNQDVGRGRGEEKFPEEKYEDDEKKKDHGFFFSKRKKKKL